MGELDELATRIECVKVAMRQAKEGFVVSLALHPNDAPEEFLRDPVGQRYVAAFVRVNEQDEPVPDQKTAVGLMAVRKAAMLAGDPRFQGWLVQIGLADEASEEHAVMAIRKYCGVVSRKELKTNTLARNKFNGLIDEFDAMLRAT